MHTAAAVRQPHHLLVGWVHVVQRLRMLGVGVRYSADMPAEDLGELDGDLLWIRADADLDDQVWVMQQAWNFLAIGPHASPSGQVQPILQLVVPAQRDPSWSV